MSTLQRITFYAAVRLMTFWLNHWAKSHNIRAALVDLDDTLWDAHQIFEDKISEVYRYLEIVLPGTLINDIQKQFEQLNKEAYIQYGVDPEPRWKMVVEGLKEIFALTDNQTTHCLELLLSIYTVPPKPFWGMYFFLEVLKCSNLRVCGVTHASIEWSEFKISSLCVAGYFDFVVYADLQQPKNATVWSKAASVTQVQPKECVVFGDNIRGDILAARDAGVRHLVWIDTGNGFSVYREGSLPKQSKTSPSIVWALPILVLGYPS